MTSYDPKWHMVAKSDINIFSSILFQFLVHFGAFFRICFLEFYFKYSLASSIIYEITNSTISQDI